MRRVLEVYKFAYLNGAEMSQTLVIKGYVGLVTGIFIEYKLFNHILRDIKL